MTNPRGSAPSAPKEAALRGALGDLIDALSDELRYEVSVTPEVRRKVRGAIEVIGLTTYENYLNDWWLADV